jgi:CrcB protein
VDKATAYLWVGLGGALGSVGRYWLAGVVAQHTSEKFPWGILLVNVSGSFAIGFLATLIGSDSRWATKHHPFIAQFLMTGICGGYTTFSAFSLLTLKLAQSDQWLQAGANIALSVIGCLVAAWLGWLAGQALRG